MLITGSSAQVKLSELMAGVHARELAFKKRVAGSERLALLDLIRAIDSVGYLRAFAPDSQVSDLPSYLDVCWLGIARALSLFVPNGMTGPGMAWSRSTPDLSMRASSILYRSGLVTHLRRLADMVRYQLAEVEMSKSGALRFVIIASDLEASDRQAIVWYAQHLKTFDRPLLDALEAEQGKWVAQELERRVSTDATFGIRYSSSRELEEYFETHAELRARSLPGHDSLPGESRIGPLTYEQYRTAVVAGMARALKHSAFVDTLSTRAGAPAARDILTIFAFDHELRDQWGGLLSLDDSQSAVMLDMIGISASDVPFVSSTFDCPQALLIRAGDQCWYKPVYGGLNNPFPWTTRKLQRTFRQDWDRAVNARETAFRQDMRMLFPEPRFYMPERPYKLRGVRGVLTDIDAVIVDRLCGTIAVFQLKWQDSFENSLAERASRQRNLTEEGNSWIETVTRYCDGLSGTERAKSLGIDASVAADAREMRLFVLTRNGAKFSGGEAQDQRAAWLSWYDMLRRCHSVRSAKDPISRIWRIGRSGGRPQMSRKLEIFELDGTRIETIAV